MTPPLNKSQQQALQAIRENPNKTVLLRGVTGSGKTNIYLHLLLEQLQLGNSAILLVPEIALSAQLISEIQKYIKGAILIHSKLTPAKRRQLFTTILEKPTPQIIVGARSALFAPVAKLGLVIIDECHDNSYHQDQNPKYSALRLASAISPRTLLGSATPNLQDFYLANSKNAVVHLDQKARATASEPKIALINLANSAELTTHRFFSDSLLAAIKTNLANHEQTLIFHNRRGSASMTLCQKCSWQALCPICFLPMTLHLDRHSLLCHTCGHAENLATSCPTCHSPNIIHKGIGTKMIESELTKLFPDARIARFDSDTAAAESMPIQYEKVKNGEIDIIIGTQSIAKGFDFPNLTLVGIVQADNGLAMPDFAAEERVFQLLCQVVGRVGRNEKLSRIFIQTYQPDNAVIKFGTTANYLAAYDYLLANRKKAHFPPFCFLLKITTVQKTESTAIKKAREIRTQILKMFPDVLISQPTPAFYERGADTYRWQIILKSQHRARLLEVVKTLPPEVRFELDPPSLL
ncbi:MAG: primosomal protein N' [Candidatus Nomurabacteria bacterium]|jgi:primosomal protein N' (replication factor Y)|nr:primosomal protein N' [Candidatus Nomurabacteria bacterium]